MNKQTFFGLADQTWQHLFGRSLEFVEPQSYEQDGTFESFVEIPIKGKHTFLLVFALPNSLAYSLASIFFQLKVSEISKEDAQDSLQEIANILAGRIQRQLSEETILDVPIKLSKEKALALMQGIEPDWEIILKDGQMPLYAGVFVGSTTNVEKPN